MKEQKDWQGRDVPADETDDTIISVWEIEPHTSDAYTSGLVRGYQDACEFAKNVLEGIMDDTDNEEDFRGIGLTVKISLREMTLREYKELSCDE